MCNLRLQECSGDLAKSKLLWDEVGEAVWQVAIHRQGEAARQVAARWRPQCLAILHQLWLGHAAHAPVSPAAGLLHQAEGHSPARQED